MSSESKKIFLEAVERVSPDQWDTFADQACGDDRVLRQRVQVLLEAHAAGGSLLDQPAIVPTATIDELPVAEGPGQTIGRYKLLKQIGEGGFGVVYQAEQTEPVHRTVAVKVIKLGMDTRQVVARFESERQAMAMMDHPCIARVLDAGSTTAGRPYFVMELVDGRPITEYCDDHRLSIPKRLELFAATCDAVDHAHMRGVIHRDIKPSNVLVTRTNGKPSPKVIDFGIAKATFRSLDDETAVTKTGQFIGTPQYVSPEQADMSPLDAGPRSDIYSLGVLLYELLTGATPFDPDQLFEAGLDEMRRIIREVEPPRPSIRLRSLDDTVAEVASKRDTDPQSLSRQVTGDLDWITLKALEKDPGSRYATARDLVDEIGRYLENRPILAKRPTLAKQLSKWTQRHLAIAASGVLVLLISVSVLALSNLSIRGARDQALMQKTEAERQKAEAEKQLRISTSLRLAAQSRSVRNETPIQSLLLAVEATQVTRRHDQGVPLLVRESLLEALSVIGGRPLLGTDAPVAVTSPAISAGGRWMATSSQEEVRLWDLTRPWNSRIVLRGQEATTAVLDVSSDGRWIVTSEGLHESRDVHLWDLTAADPLTVLRGHTEYVTRARISPDRRWLVTGSRDATVRVWDLTAEDPIVAVKVLCGDEGRNIEPRAFSPDGRWLVTQSAHRTTRLWDLAAENPDETSIVLPMKEHETTVKSAAFSPDGRWLATGSSVYRADRNTAVKLWDMTSDNPAAAPVELPGDSVETEVVAFSPDGRWLVSAGLDSLARLWDVTAADPASTKVELRGHSWDIWDAAFSPDSHWLVTAGADKTARVWDLNAKSPSTVSMVLRGHEAIILKTAFTPDSQWVITWSRDQTARVWNIAPGTFGLAATGEFGDKTFALPTTPRLLWQQPALNQMWMVDDGAKFMTSNHRGEATLWDPSSTDPWRSATRFFASKESGEGAPPVRVRTSPNGRWMACFRGDETVLWDLRAQDTLSSEKLLPGHPVYNRDLDRFSGDGRWLLHASFGSGEPPYPVYYQQVAPSPDGRWLVSPDWDCPLTLWDLFSSDSARRPLTLRGENQDPTGPVPDPRVWDLNAADPAAASFVLRGHHGVVGIVAFSDDSRWLATAGQDRTIRMWDMHAEAPASRPVVLHGPQAPIKRIGFSADGKWLVSGPNAENASGVHLWELSDREFRTRPFHLPGQGIAKRISPAVSPFSPDGRWLSTVGAEGPVRLWDLTADDPSAAPVALRGHEGRPSATAFSPDGRWLATGGAQSLLRDETVRLWDLTGSHRGIDCVVLRGHSSPCTAATFTANSRQLVTRCADGEIRVWDLRLEKLIQLARQAAGRRLTPEEREKYLLPTTP